MNSKKYIVVDVTFFILDVTDKEVIDATIHVLDSILYEVS